MPIKLIPKEYIGQRPTIFGGFQLPIFRKSFINLFLGLAIGCLCLSLLSYLILTLSNHSLERKRAFLEREVKNLEATRDLDLESQVVELQKRIKIFRQFLEAHIYPSKLFTLLEELTIPQVQFTSFNADLEKGQLNLAGQTVSYSFLAKQLTVLEQDERIKKVEISNIALQSEKGVGFNLLLEFDRQILKFQN